MPYSPGTVCAGDRGGGGAAYRNWRNNCCYFKVRILEQRVCALATGRPWNSNVLIVTACNEFFCCEQLGKGGLAADEENSRETRWQRRSKFFDKEDGVERRENEALRSGLCNNRDSSLVTLLLLPVSLEDWEKGNHLYSVRHPSHLVKQCLTEEGPQKSTCWINEWNNRWMNTWRKKCVTEKGKRN